MALALVTEGAPLTSDELRRYARQLQMPEWGISGQRRVKNSRVLVIGAGGLGSPALLYLAAAGMGTLGVVDEDTVAESNLHRQVLHGTASLSVPKTTSAAKALAAVNPLVVVREHAVRLDADNVHEILAEYDLVIDGSDNFATRYLVSDAAADRAMPHVWGSVLRGDGQVSVFWENGDPQSRTLRDLFPAGGDDAVSCETAGVIGPLCGAIGCLMAVEAVKLLVGFGESLRGSVLVVDALDNTHLLVPFGRRRPDSVPLPSPLPALGEPVTEPTPSLTPGDLARMLEDRESGSVDFLLVDIREPFEREIVSIDGSLFIPMQSLLSEESRAALPQESAIVLHCHHDSRSSYAREVMVQHGWQDVRFLEGGVHAWAVEIEPHKSTY